MSNIIIVEGPDGAGKTTLINKLLATYKDSKVFKFSNPKNPNEEQLSMYANALVAAAKECETVIFDRSWFSELVYGPIVRGTHIFNNWQLETLDNIVRGLGGGMVIYVTADINTLWRRCQKRGETYIKTKAQLDELRLKYEEVLGPLSTVTSLPIVRMFNNVDTVGK